MGCTRASRTSERAFCGVCVSTVFAVFLQVVSRPRLRLCSILCMAFPVGLVSIPTSFMPTYEVQLTVYCRYGNLFSTLVLEHGGDILSVG